MPMKADDDRFDGLYLNLAQQNQGIDNLLESFFGFLRRKTDFYSGASETQIEESLLKVKCIPKPDIQFQQLYLYFHTSYTVIPYGRVVPVTLVYNRGCICF